MKGFSLIELLCALTIVGILSAIAYPSYQSYLHQSYREAAKAQLVDLSAGLAQQRLANTSGALPSDAARQIANTINRDYVFSLTVNNNGVDYILRATPFATGRQVRDGVLFLASTGLGCWHEGNDTETADSCLADKDHTW